MATLKDKYGTYQEENLGTNDFAMLAGGGSPGATQINKKHFRISACASNNDSGIFTQAALPGAEYFGENNTANTAAIFPFAGDKFEDQAVNAAFSFEAGAAWHFVCITAGKWRIK